MYYSELIYGFERHNLDSTDERGKNHEKKKLKCNYSSTIIIFKKPVREDLRFDS